MTFHLFYLNLFSFYTKYDVNEYTIPLRQTEVNIKGRNADMRGRDKGMKE